MGKLMLESSVSEIKGVGKVTLSRLEKLGIFTVRDLVYFFPRVYEHRSDFKDLSNFTPEVTSAFMLTVATEAHTVTIRRGLTLTKFRAFDKYGSVEIIFYNCPFVDNVFHIGSEFRFYGKISYNRKNLQMINPKYEPFVEGIPLPDYVPIYPLTQGISSKQIDKLIQSLLDEILPQIIDPLPEEIRLENNLSTLSYAIKNAHSPDNSEALSIALSRLAFDELLQFGIGIAISSRSKSNGNGIRFLKSSLNELTSILPYELTDSQKKAINDIYIDTVLGKNGIVSPMARIIVGDVGCGKTVCAIAAMYLAAKSSVQSVLMVPTEILARQHHKDVSNYFDKLGIKTELLLGSTKAKERRRIYEAVESGECRVVIGTHALLSDKINYKSLGLIITDEQHRFGVMQRAALKERASSAHVLVMSATPIPRTLALTMYGDLDISRITDMPAGRQRVDTYVVNESYRDRINAFIQKEVSRGGQCYVVCPSIETDSEDSENTYIPTNLDSITPAKSLNLKSAIEYSSEIQKALPNLRIGLLHGKMRTKEKDDVMSLFEKGDLDVLVSTTVIEVGVNVPNASLMIVENAERFGLSQLHQLRGRVGRGDRKSYCILVSDSDGEKAQSRLEVMKTTYDGYEIAENDLLIRGPGDFFADTSAIGIRQSGGFDFKFASLCNNTALLDKAFAIAKAIVKEDPELSAKEHALLRANIFRHLDINSSTLS